MTTEDTPGASPAMLNPTLATVARQIVAVSKQIALLRNDLDEISAKQSAVRQDVGVVLRSVSAAPPAGDISPATPTPSLAVKAAQKTVGVTRYGLIALGALGVAAQVAALFKPGMVGPIQTLIQLLQLVTGAQ